MNLRGLFSFFGAILFLFSPLAWAQTPADEDLKKAQKDFQEAEKHYDLQEYEKALALYKESYQLSNEPALLFNIGQCQKQLKQYGEAITSYKAFLRRSPDYQNQAAINALIKEMEEKLDQQKSNVASQPILLPSSTLPSTAKSALTPLDTPKESTSSLAPKLLFGAAGGAVVFGIVYTAQGLSAKKEAESLLQSRDPGLSDAARANAERAAKLGKAAYAMYGLAAVAGGVGVVLQVKEKKKVELSASPMGVALTGEF